MPFSCSWGTPDGRARTVELSYGAFPFDFALDPHRLSGWLQTLPGHPWPLLHPRSQERMDPQLSCLLGLSCPRAGTALHHPCCQPVFKENIEFLGIREGSVDVVCTLGHVHHAESLFSRRSTISSCMGGMRQWNSIHFLGRNRAELLHHWQHLAVLRRVCQAPLCSLTCSLHFSLACACPERHAAISTFPHSAGVAGMQRCWSYQLLCRFLVGC